MDRGQGAGDVQEPVRLRAADAELRVAVRLPTAVPEREPDAGGVRIADPGGEHRHGAPGGRPRPATITRNDVIVHQGRHALARPDTAERRITSVVGDGAIGWAVVREREYTPAEMSALEQKIISRCAEISSCHDHEQQAGFENL
ncbi:hypothetical protein [Streptomyces sp. NPDC046631]|uniref:hypothetical protein n=1 Tax=unclassified Streptomyces TaxID=2593676 RepID=UPI0033C6DB90